MDFIVLIVKILVFKVLPEFVSKHGGLLLELNLISRTPLDAILLFFKAVLEHEIAGIVNDFGPPLEQVIALIPWIYTYIFLQL